MDDLQREFNRKILALAERLTGSRPQDREIAELRELLLTMELTGKLKPPPTPKPSTAVDWWKLLPLLLTLALILAATIAALLGVEIGGIL